MRFNSDVRPSPISGSWYLGDPQALAEQMDVFIQQAVLSEDEYAGKVIGLLAPHAGHRYSGRTAGYAYKLVQGNPRALVIILAPMHQYMTGEIFTTSHRAYQTPLGELPVAQEELNRLEQALQAHGSSLIQVTRDEEHSLEIQLPFLQRAWQQDFSLLPIMLRTLDAVKLKELADAIYSVVKGQDFLVIASTDLSHFYPLDMAEALDAEMLRRVKAFQPEAVLTAEQEGSAAACGAGAVAAMLWIAKHVGADQVHILNYSTSADATGDASAVVGYASAAVLQSLS